MDETRPLHNDDISDPGHKDASYPSDPDPVESSQPIVPKSYEILMLTHKRDDEFVKVGTSRTIGWDAPRM